MSIAERLALAPELRDTEKWPSPELEDIRDESQDLFVRRKDAITSYLNGSEALADIYARTGIPKSEIYRLLERCLSTHRNGAMFGFYALVPGSKLIGYRRTAPVPARPVTGPVGLAGAFLQLMAAHVELREYVEKQALRSKTKDSRTIAKQIHLKFLERCAKVRAPNEYPFNTDDRARRPLTRYVERFLLDHQSEKQTAGSAGGGYSGKTAQPSLVQWLRPFEEIEHDGHNGDFYFVVKVPGLRGEWVYTTPMKLWLLLPVCRASRAILGYSYCLGSTNYPAISVMQSFSNIYKRWEPKTLTIPGLAYKEGAGFPSGVVPESHGVLIDLVCFDNAKGNTARQVTRRPLLRTMGATLNFGRAGEPIARPFVERLNLTLETLGFRRLPVGFNPKGPKEERERALKAAEAHAVTIDELEQVLDVMLANYNADAHSSLVNRSPNAFLKMWFSQASGPIRRVEDPAAFAKQLLRLEFIKRIRQGGKARRPPYIELLGARYSSDVVLKIQECKGLTLRVIVDVDGDVRFARAFLRSAGRETDIGILHALPPWHLTPHTLTQRQLVQKANRTSKIIVPPGSDMIQAFRAIRLREAAERRSAANDVAKLGAVKVPASAKESGRRNALIRVLKKNWVSIK